MKNEELIVRIEELEKENKELKEEIIRLKQMVEAEKDIANWLSSWV